MWEKISKSWLMLSIFWSSSFSKWRLWCFDSWAFYLNALPQSWHLNGFWPEWIRRWSFKLHLLSNSRLHTPQIKIELSLWVYLFTILRLTQRIPSTTTLVVAEEAWWNSCIILNRDRIYFSSVIRRWEPYFSPLFGFNCVVSSDSNCF